jgi:hypothetical protein
MKRCVLGWPAIATPSNGPCTGNRRYCAIVSYQLDAVIERVRDEKIAAGI